MSLFLDLHTNRVKLVFPGDILSTNVETLRAEIFSEFDSAAFLSAGYQEFDFDFRKAQMIDSAGLNLIIAILRQIKKKPTRVSALVSNAHVFHILLFTRLDRQMEIVMSEDAVTV